MVVRYGKFLSDSNVMNSMVCTQLRHGVIPEENIWSARVIDAGHDQEYIVEGICSVDGQYLALACWEIMPPLSRIILNRFLECTARKFVKFQICVLSGSGKFHEGADNVTGFVFAFDLE